ALRIGGDRGEGCRPARPGMPPHFFGASGREAPRGSDRCASQAAVDRRTALRKSTERLCRELAPLEFADPVTHVYNPLVYARAAHFAYLDRYATTPKRVIYLGMNPGPFGMAQTGVPFGEVSLVRDWLGISASVDKPPNEHPKRPILGFDCA